MWTAFLLLCRMKRIQAYYKLDILILVLLLLSFQSCKKDGPTFIVSGRLLEDCSMKPVPNQSLDLFQEYLMGLDGRLNGGILAQTTTDANGNFSFEFKDEHGSTYSIRRPAGLGYKKLIENIPQNQSIFNINVFKSLTSHIKVSLQVSNAYTTSDTLFITDFRNLSKKLKVAGPFLNGTLYTAEDFPILNNNYAANIESIGYKINNANWTILPFTFNNCDTTIINVPIK